MACFPFLLGWKTSGHPSLSPEVDEEIYAIDNVKIFTYNELRKATDGFSDFYKIGEGGFGPVYKTWELYERRELVGLVDAAMNGDFDAEEACRFLKVGLLCTQQTSKQRPSMSTAVKMLTGELQIDDNKIKKPVLISDYADRKVGRPQKQSESKSNSYPDASSGSQNQTTSIFTSENSERGW
ncbi:hypothetical protein SAY87_012401 [Trapa incisa]|uniref:Uncharacterized protein n=1 Tax=Trapa incisa TaxID=236973 RepID=A0AAN7GQ79_9MYRT|nr:hypothetical protein SAY87_012401 [Trapa incisa]